LKNQWVFADMEFAVTIARNGTVQAPSGFTSCNAVLSPTTPQPGQMARCSSHADLAVHWDQDGGTILTRDGAQTGYVIRIGVMGPKGFNWY